MFEQPLLKNFRNILTTVFEIYSPNNNSDLEINIAKNIMNTLKHEFGINSKMYIVDYKVIVRFYTDYTKVYKIKKNFLLKYKNPYELKKVHLYCKILDTQETLFKWEAVKDAIKKV